VSPPYWSVSGVVVEPLVYTLGWLAALCAAYGALAVYLDAVVPGEPHPFNS